MFRKIRRRLTGRARATLLLCVWVASVVLTVVHDDGDGDGRARARDGGGVSGGSSDSTVVAACDSNGPCHDPAHHHAPLGHHDVTQCPYCAMLLERPAEMPVFSFAPPAAVHFVVATLALRLSSSQRCACALARGPPPVVAPV